jgi:hypothetical protein
MAKPFRSREEDGGKDCIRSKPIGYVCSDQSDEAIVP